MERIFYDLEDVMIGNIIKIDKFVQNHIDLASGKPFVKGKCLEGGRNNLFVKEGQVYKNILTGKTFKELKGSCKVGDVGLQPYSLKPLTERFKLALKVHNIKTLQMNKEDVARLQNLLSVVSSENDLDYAYIFGKFIEFTNEENEKE